MNQLLSLALGKSSPPGLSGGATPSAAPKLSFADLLTTPLPAAMTPTSVAAGMPGAPTMVGDGQTPAPLRNPMLEPAGTLPPPGPEAQTLDSDSPSQPVPGLKGNAPISQTAVPLVATEATDTPPGTGHGKAPASGFDATALRAGSTPGEAAVRIDDASMPKTDQTALSAESTHPPLDPTQPPVEQEPDDGPADGLPAAETGIDPEIVAAPEMRQETLVSNPAVAPSPTPAATHQAAPEDIAQPLDIIPEDEHSRQSMRTRSDGADAPSPRLASAAPTSTGGASDFAQILRNDAVEAPSPSLESGAGHSEILSPTRTDPGRHQVGPGAPSEPLPQTVSARPGEIGRQLGVEIVRHGLNGRDSLTIRLDPVEMGEIQIRLQFDERGTMRAHVAAESSAALEMLRRDSADLVRALGDAGVRTDAQSFQFEGRGQGRGDQNNQHSRPETASGTDPALAEAVDDDQPLRSKLRSSGSIDLFA